MAETCSHKDQERKGVGRTAHVVASLRALEEKREPGDRLFADPFAKLMGGAIGQAFIDSFKDKESKPLGLIDGIAVRTKKIDDALETAIEHNGIRQICVLGAGLDTRPWRLDLAKGNETCYFEVDFSEIFSFKLPVLAHENAVPKFTYVSAVTDLSVSPPTWPDNLIQLGFNTSTPTFWILEGLTGYLTESEALQMFELITRISAVGSKIIATFMTPNEKLVKTDMHRYLPENPLRVMNSFGWDGVQEDIYEVAANYNRPIRDDCMRGYYLVSVAK